MATVRTRAMVGARAQVRHPLRVLLSRRPHEPDFALFAHLPQRRGLFLDLGAHAGQSAASFHLFKPGWNILAFEPDPAMQPSLRLLAHLLRGRLELRRQGVGASRGVGTLLVPTAAGRRLEGEASFDRACLEQHGPTRDRLASLAGGAPIELRAVTSPMLPLDDLELAPGAVKLDLQGGELAAMQGMMTTLERHRPPVLMENNRHSEPITAALAPMGYRPRNWAPVKGSLIAPANPFEALNLVLVTQAHLAWLPHEAR